MSRRLIDFLGKFFSVVERDPSTQAEVARLPDGAGLCQSKTAEAPPAVKCGNSILDAEVARPSEGAGLFQGKTVKAHPAVKSGDSILDKAFAVEFRTERNGVSVEIGDKCILKNKIIFETDSGFVKIGDGCYIGGSRIISACSVVIGNWVTIAWNVTIYDHDSHSLDYRERIKDQEQQLLDWKTGNFIKNKNWAVVNKKPITIGDYVWIGFDAVILKGVTVGTGAIIGARSVVTKDVEPWTVVAGNPARFVKRLPPEGDGRDASR